MIFKRVEVSSQNSSRHHIQPFLQTKKQKCYAQRDGFQSATPGQPVNQEVPPLGSLRSMSRGPLQERVWQSGARCGVLGCVGIVRLLSSHDLPIA